MSSSEIYAKPEALRQFADGLAENASFYEASMRNLDAYIAQLGQSWRDQQFETFAREIRALHAVMNDFTRAAGKVRVTLLKDAEQLEIYQRIQLG